MLDLRHMDAASHEQSIIKTLAHFDVLDYPLTLLEIANFNGLGLPVAEIRNLLNNEKLQNLISRQNGFYCLRGREAIMPLRLSRYRLALPKLKRARRFASLFSCFPWIRAVAVYSSLALKNSRRDSDIDLFFITAAGRAWSARFWLNLFLKLFRLRPTQKNSCDKLCASYLADENNLDLSCANLDSDYFYAYGCAAFAFLSGSSELQKKFWQANPWLKDYLPGWQPAESVRQNRSGGFRRRWQSLWERIFGLIAEAKYHDLQMKILPRKYSISNDGQKVILGKGIIKLHDNDKRTGYNELFKKNYEHLITDIEG